MRPPPLPRLASTALVTTFVTICASRPGRALQFDGLVGAVEARLAVGVPQRIAEQQQSVAHDRNGIEALACLRRKIAGLSLDAAHEVRGLAGGLLGELDGVFHV